MNFLSHAFLRRKAGKQSNLIRNVSGSACDIYTMEGIMQEDIDLPFAASHWLQDIFFFDKNLQADKQKQTSLSANKTFPKREKQETWE